MNFTTIFAQYKIARDTLAALTPEQQEGLERAAWGADWFTDAGGGLLSPLLALRVPPDPEPGGNAPPLTQPLDFPWADRATQGQARQSAQAQLVVFDVSSAAPLGGEMRLIHSAHFADTHGDPLLAYAPAPHKLGQQVIQAERADMGLGQLTRTSVLAYRTLTAGQDVRTLEARLVFLPRKNQVSKVRWLAAYDHALKVQGGETLHVCQLRAALDQEGSGKRNFHASTLGSTQLSTLALHALSAGSTRPYAALDDEAAPAPTAAARRLLDDLLNPAVPAPPKVKPPKPPKAPKASRKTKPAPPEPEPAPVQVSGPAAEPPLPAKSQVPELPSPESPSPEIPSPEIPSPESPFPEPPPVGSGSGARPAEVQPPAPEPAPDPWAALDTRIVVDEDVLAVSRAALEQRRPLLLTGAPGTGKTLLATLLAEVLCGPGNFTLVTADARWTSSEVLGGLRVMPGEGLRYSFVPGVVTQAAQRHRESLQASGRPHALIIDEFNRAHQDEAFGRLLTLLDRPYRAQMPLVGVQDGAPEDVFLPPDFVLIATMNDADVGRLHEIGSALQRRFVTVPVGVPARERDFLERSWAHLPAATLTALYDFVGSGDPGSDREAGRLRGFVTVGTFFMEEVLGLATTLGLDRALRSQVAPQLGSLGRDDLAALEARARQTGLPKLAAQLALAGQQAPF